MIAVFAHEQLKLPDMSEQFGLDGPLSDRPQWYARVVSYVLQIPVNCCSHFRPSQVGRRRNARRNETRMVTTLDEVTRNARMLPQPSDEWKFPANPTHLDLSTMMHMFEDRNRLELTFTNDNRRCVE